MHTVFDHGNKQMKGYEGHKMHAVQQRLLLAVNSIVERHRTNGQVLTWLLVHEIEREALKTLEQAGDLDIRYIRRMRSSRWGWVPKVDQPADLQSHTSLPIALTMIQDAYFTSH
jgi:hypothetical protein